VGGDFQSRDELYAAAVDIVVRERRGSCSLLQRALGIGYGRAARLIDFMAEDGVVGQYNGSQARDVLISLEDWETRNRGTGGDVAVGTGPNGGLSSRTPTEITTASVAPRRRNKIAPELEESEELEDEEEDEIEDEEEDEVDDEQLDEDEEWEDEDDVEESEDDEYVDDEELDEEDSDEEEDEEWEDEEDADDDEWEEDEAEEDEELEVDESPAGKHRR
jgi:S-DNA-T family DNA segregation ATPase FtsK/SpoIIIE